MSRPTLARARAGWSPRRLRRPSGHERRLRPGHGRAAKGQWRKLADQVRPSLPKLAQAMEEAEDDVLAYMTFSKAHRTKLHSTDVIDKRLVEGAVISSRRADDLVAKSGARLQAPSGRLQVLPV